ncbi:hypothetical protein [Streptomyces sp. ISL-100]|uniref:hypothetical protein n=1 Tax=Streptomyces sp. ISL-100 TaxID=2819173 RepID=UPI001BE5959C|nr:hypothetical protein [Streptomyces sp. ISL-100]MBT2396286.1 hypothetical protein [Streptomyces sp. ISL-100]
MPENTPAPDSFPLLIGAQVEAHALIVRRQTCDEVAAMLRANGQSFAADLVEEDRDFTELSRSLATIPAPVPKAQHAAGCGAFDCRCGCTLAQGCQDCGRCACWRAECRAQEPVDRARREERKAALRRLLDGVGTAMLTELRETAAAAEEAALRHAVARRVGLLAPGDGRRYEVAVFEAKDSKLCMGHADWDGRDVELYAPGQDDPNEVVDWDDEVLAGLLGALAELLRPEEGARLVIDLCARGAA